MMKTLRTLSAVVLMSALLPTAGRAGDILLELDGTGTGTFAGLGTNTVTYTDTVQVENINTGVFEDFDLVLTLNGSAVVTLTPGVGIGVGGDASIEDGESLGFQVDLTPSAGTQSLLEDFQFTRIGHGVTVSDFPNDFVSIEDSENNTNILADNYSGDTSIANLAGNSITLATSTAPFGAGSIAGISSLGFDATAAPEPSAIALCMLMCGGFVLRRKERPVLT